jgi:TolB-like protein/AraC-like DNA-binding protein/Tfp pilus assembly protein PilF
MQQNASMDDQFLCKIYQHIEDNLDNENFSVEDLAQKAGLSRSMLHRKLIKLTGKSASDLITEKKLLRAKEMLLNNVATASEIAYKVGFSSPSYFTKVFKNYFHVSPGDVRKGTIPLVSNENSSIKPRNISRSIIWVSVIIVTVALTGIGTYYYIKNSKPVEKSIAILPFDNLSSNSENQFFADGIVEDLLNRLSKIEGLKVISRTSSEMFRDKGSKTIPEIADLLHVSYILEGTVQRETNNVRINIQLIDAKKDNHILSQQYDRNLSEVFKIQSEIADQIVRELSIVLTEPQADKLNKKQTNSLKAFEYKQLGRYHLNKRTQDDLHNAIEYFRRALEEDPNYALVFAELADAYYISGWYDYIDRKKGMDSAEYFALKALSLDENVGEAHTVLGAKYFDIDWNFSLAEKEFKQALAISPNLANTYMYYADLMTTLVNLGKARKLYDKAIQLDPYSYIIRFASSYAFFREKKYEEALIEFKICQGLGKDNSGPLSKEFLIYVKTGNSKAALECYKKLGKMTGDWTPETADSVFQTEGIRGLLKWKLKIGKWPYRIDEAQYYALLGEKDKALDILENALEEGYLVPFNTADPEFEDLHSDPRFIAIRKKMGLPPL